MTRLASCVAVAEHTSLFRKKDGRRFKFARFSDLDGAVTRRCVYLEEV
jgi:hypothetical protein